MKILKIYEDTNFGHEHDEKSQNTTLRENVARFFEYKTLSPPN